MRATSLFLCPFHFFLFLPLLSGTCKNFWVAQAEGGKRSEKGIKTIEQMVLYWIKKKKGRTRESECGGKTVSQDLQLLPNSPC